MHVTGLKKCFCEIISWSKNPRDDSSEIDHNIYPPNRWYTSDGVSYPIKGNKYHENYINFFKKKLVEKNINKIYTIEPYGKNTFDFVFKLDCVETLKINEILFQHKITNCFANFK